MGDGDFSVTENLIIAPPEMQQITIGRKDGDKQLVTLTFTDDGRLVAAYDPADLDEAARVFFDAVSAMAGRIWIH